jgi:tetratricopeptide (TPR) repeat protein
MTPASLRFGFFALLTSLSAASIAWDTPGVPDPGPGVCVRYCDEPTPSPGPDDWEREERRQALREQRAAEEAARAERQRAYDALYNGAQQAMNAGAWSEAENMFRRMLAMRPGFNGYYGLGYCLTRQGRYGEAEAAFEASRKAGAPSSLWKGGMALAQRYRGHDHLQSNALREAEAALRRALEYDAKDAWSWDALGIALYRQGRLDEAEKALKKAAGYDRKEKRYADNLALVVAEHAAARKREEDRKAAQAIATRIDRAAEKLRSDAARRDPVAALQGFKNTDPEARRPLPLEAFSPGNRDVVRPRAKPSAMQGSDTRALDQGRAAAAAGVLARQWAADPLNREGGSDKASEVFDKGGAAVGGLDTAVVDGRAPRKEPVVPPERRTPAIERLEQQRNARKLEREVLEQKLAAVEADQRKDPVAVVELRQKVDEVRQTEVYLNFAITEELAQAPDPAQAAAPAGGTPSAGAKEAK